MNIDKIIMNKQCHGEQACTEPDERVESMALFSNVALREPQGDHFAQL